MKPVAPNPFQEYVITASDEELEQMTDMLRNEMARRKDKEKQDLKNKFIRLFIEAKKGHIKILFRGIPLTDYDSSDFEIC